METKRKQRNKKASGKASDRSKQLMIQAVLSVLVVVLLFGNSYAAVKIVHGQPVIWNDSFASVGTQAESGSESGAPGQAASGRRVSLPPPLYRNGTPWRPRKAL